jgi:hypothetical protein
LADCSDYFDSSCTTPENPDYSGFGKIFKAENPSSIARRNEDYARWRNSTKFKGSISGEPN